MAQAIRRSLVSDQVFRALAEDVLCDRYAPGEKLPTQRRLAADLGVNMASVREAVKRLEQLGLVEVRHGDAMRVRDWRTDGGLDVVTHVLFRAGGLDVPTLDALMEARRLMLREAARLAAERREDPARLQELAQAFAAVKPDEAQPIDFAFFSELVEAADNVVFVLILNSIRRLYFDRAELFHPLVADRDRLAPLYSSAAQAVADGDGDAAAAAVEELASVQEEALR
jgi:GntR family transcriptional regulator, transcriptional repressor for pyruvate dehydrogenase complex